MIADRGDRNRVDDSTHFARRGTVVARPVTELAEVVAAPAEDVSVGTQHTRMRATGCDCDHARQSAELVVEDEVRVGAPQLHRVVAAELTQRVVAPATHDVGRAKHAGVASASDDFETTPSHHLGKRLEGRWGTDAELAAGVRAPA